MYFAFYNVMLPRHRRPPSPPHVLFGVCKHRSRRRLRSVLVAEQRTVNRLHLRVKSAAHLWRLSSDGRVRRF